MFRGRRHLLHKVAAWCGTGAVTGFTIEPLVRDGWTALATPSPLPSSKELDPTVKTAARVHSTSGPLLDWFYVHAGYVNYKKGYAEQWDVPQGIEIAVQPAEKSDPLVLPDRPWEQAGIGSTSGTYKKDGKYVMHYQSYNGYRCIAQSRDGFNWTKPDLGLVEFQGSKNNNIIYSGPGSSGHIFEDPSAPPSERFKLVGMNGGLYYPHRFDRQKHGKRLAGDRDRGERQIDPDASRERDQDAPSQDQKHLDG